MRPLAVTACSLRCTGPRGRPSGLQFRHQLAHVQRAGALFDFRRVALLQATRLAQQVVEAGLQRAAVQFAAAAVVVLRHLAEGVGGREGELGGRTQEYRFATYVEAWRQKVEKIGNLNYPEAAKEQKLYGKLQLSVDIRADGSIDKIQVTRSSGHKILDDAAKRIVELAAPYAAFPEDIRKEYDIIGITRTWTFTKEDSLATQ